MAFKKDLTPLTRKGSVITNRGKGSTQQRTAPRETETLTGGSPMARMMNQYPAAAPAPTPARSIDLGQTPAAGMPGTGIPDKV